MFAACLWRRKPFEVSFELKDFDPELIRVLFGEETYQRIYGKEPMNPPLQDSELNEIRALWKKAVDDVGTSTYAYRALVQVPRLFDEIERLRRLLDDRTEGQTNAEMMENWRAER